MLSHRANGNGHGTDAVGAKTARFSTFARALAVLLLVSSASYLGFGETTGWLNPSAEAGEFAKATNAFYDDNSVADLDNAQTHQFWGYGVTLPAGAIIHGIEVRVDAERVTQEAAEIQLEVSWDGGLSWTSTGHSTGSLSPTMSTHIAGSPTDTWDRSWFPSEFEDGSFRVRAMVISAGTGKVVKLDWLPVAITYDTQTLELSTQSLDFAPLTLADFDSGFQEIAPAQTLTVSSSCSWVITIQAASTAWVYVGSFADPFKPCADLEWMSTSVHPSVTYVSGSYSGLSTSPTLVASGDAGSEIPVVLDARMLVSYALDPPGDYSIEITYVLTTP